LPVTEPRIVLSPNGRRPPDLDQSLLALSAAGSRYGDIEVRGHADPVGLRVTAAGLPPVDLIAPTRIGGPRLRCFGPATRMSVAGVTASFAQRPLGLTRGQRALHIQLGDAGYHWTALTLISTNQLVNEATGPVAVTRWTAGNAVITPTPAATATDTAVALALCVGLDADALHILRLLAP
jgi:hypothetical protein